MNLKTSDGKELENVKVVAVNTEACYNFNYFLMKLRDDPGDQLKWLENTLYEMEANGQIAILIGHHPPGDSSCMYQWSSRFRALMERFQNVVRFSFFGHVHTEQHNVIKSFSTGKSVGINYWTGSMTTYSDTYPSFRHFVVDKETLLPLRVETYRMDVEAENPEFVLDHEMTEFYEMSDLSPSSFDDLSSRIQQDEATAMKYINTQSQ